MALCDRIYDVKLGASESLDSCSSSLVKAGHSVYSSASNLKSKLTKDLNGKTIYQDFYDNNRSSLEAYLASVKSGKTDIALGRRISKGIDGLKFSKLTGSFKFGDLIFVTREDVLKFGGAKFPNVSLYKFLEIILDSFCLPEKVEDVYNVMKSLNEKKIKCGFLDVPSVFLVIPNEGETINYSMNYGNIVLNNTNADESVLREISEITGNLLPCELPRNSVAQNDDSLSDGSISDDSVQDDSVSNDSLKGNSIENNSIQDDSLSNNSFPNESLIDESILNYEATNPNANNAKVKKQSKIKKYLKGKDKGNSYDNNSYGDNPYDGLFDEAPLEIHSEYCDALSDSDPFVIPTDVIGDLSIFNQLGDE